MKVIHNARRRDTSHARGKGHLSFSVMYGGIIFHARGRATFLERGRVSRHEGRGSLVMKRGRVILHARGKSPLYSWRDSAEVETLDKTNIA
jgi:hypothetical protein